MGKLPALLFLGGAALAIGGCGPSPPELAKDLPLTELEGELAFRDRVVGKFTGRPVEGLISDLSDQNFMEKPRNDNWRTMEYRDLAIQSGTIVPIKHVWSVKWRENEGLAVEVMASYYHADW